jgi:hypothetical protein
MGNPPTCPFCEEPLIGVKCECGAWKDSYGLIHQEDCQGGFHEDCDNPHAEEEATAK